jgi:hypothetical protein
MGLNLTSFLLGLGAAWLLPMVARTIRPLAVEATAAGIGLLEDARRIAAEQLETLEDIAAEAKARREELLASAGGNGHHVAGEPGMEDAGADAEAGPRARRRSPARRRAS